MRAKVSDHMRPGEVWMSEWDVEWRVVRVTDQYAVVKRIGGRAEHHVNMREVDNWERVEETVAMREP